MGDAGRVLEPAFTGRELRRGDFAQFTNPPAPQKRASLREIFPSLSLRLTQIRSRDAGREPDRSPKAKSCPQGKASHLLAPILEPSPRCSERSNSEPTVAHAICRFQPSR